MQIIGRMLWDFRGPFLSRVAWNRRLIKVLSWSFVFGSDPKRIRQIFLLLRLKQGSTVKVQSVDRYRNCFSKRRGGFLENQLVEMVKLTVIFAWVSTASSP